MPTGETELSCAHEGRATVLFSGGSDSMLVAALALESFSGVDLLTCRRDLMFFVDNSRKTAVRMAHHLGKERVSYAQVDVGEPFALIFKGDLGRDLGRFDTHLTLLVCLACKMAMHGAAIVHNLRTGNRVTMDGARRETDWFPAQMEPVKERMVELHEQYGLSLESPVYEIVGTDERLHELGLVEDRALKGQFLLHDNQPSCVFGSVAHVYTRLFYGPFCGEEQRLRDALEYFERKREVLTRWIDEEADREVKVADHD